MCVSANGREGLNLKINTRGGWDMDGEICGVGSTWLSLYFKCWSVGGITPFFLISAQWAGIFKTMIQNDCLLDAEGGGKAFLTNFFHRGGGGSLKIPKS